MNDETLINQIRQRDQEAMVMLHARYANLIYSVVYRILSDSSGTEEVVQDAFMKAWQNAPQFDASRGPLVAWLIGIARNVAIDRVRKWNRQVQIAEPGELEDADTRLELLMPDDWQDRERANGLKFAVEALPAEQRQVIELSYYGGMSQSEIAEQLSLPLGTVKTRMRLGMQKLRDAWLGSDDRVNS
jgi:RNA polymerase sigma-70 factor (ECF subfamily)